MIARAFKLPRDPYAMALLELLASLKPADRDKILDSIIGSTPVEYPPILEKVARAAKDLLKDR
jgi:hypothetical protein